MRSLIRANYGSWVCALGLFSAPLAVSHFFASHLRVVSALGLVSLAALAWMLSWNRRVVPWRVVVSGLLFQVLLGFIILSPGVQ